MAEPDPISCPECGCRTVNPLHVTDMTGESPYENDKYGSVWELRFYCGGCLSHFVWTVAHRYGSVVIETRTLRTL